MALDIWITCCFFLCEYIRSVYMHSQETWVKYPADVVNVIEFSLEKEGIVVINTNEETLPWSRCLNSRKNRDYCDHLSLFHTKVCLPKQYSFIRLLSAYEFSGILLGAIYLSIDFSFQGAYSLEIRLSSTLIITIWWHWIRHMCLVQ